MKRVTTPFQREDATYFCDKHPDRECATQLELISWYGSIYDMTKVEAHLCDECVKEMRQLLEKEFKVKPEDINI
jgi:hypothetical protein